jgi:hypothetical protein
MLATENLPRIVALTSETVTPVPVGPDRHIFNPLAK